MTEKTTFFLSRMCRVCADKLPTFRMIVLPPEFSSEK